MKSYSKIFQIFALLFLPLIATATQPDSSEYCKLLLQPRAIQTLSDSIPQKIANRTAPLNQGIPQIIDSDGTPIDVMEMMNRELAKPILDSTKRAALIQVEELTRIWVTTAREDIRYRYEEDKQNKVILQYDADGLPITDIVQSNREAALTVVAANREKFNQGKIRSDKIAPIELEQQTTQIVIDQIKKKYTTLIKEKADSVINQIEKQLQKSANQFKPDWNLLNQEIAPILAALKNDLTSQFPIGRAVSRNTKASIMAVEAQNTPLAEPLLTQLNASGIPEILLNELGLRAYYDLELGTMILESNKGMTPNPDGFLLIADHGDGTVKSNASSWKYIIPKFLDSSFNPIAMNLPRSGVGMNISGLMDTTAYLDYRYRVLRKRTEPAAGQAAAPMVLLGRSMGGAKGFAHALLFDGPQNVVDAYVLTSFSNPLTLSLQTQNIYKQVNAGTIEGVVPESLDNAELFGNELTARLNELKAQNPKAFDDFGDHLFFQQGRSDEDGGPTVVEDLEKFVREFAPRSHVYYFENMLTRYNIPHLEKINPEKWEATHILFSNQSNYSRDSLKKSIDSLKARSETLTQEDKEILEALEAIYTQVSPEDFPALQDQYIEATASMYGFFDYLAQSQSQRPEMRRAAQVFIDFRQRLTGGKSYLEYYADKLKITPADLAAAKAGRSSRAARLKRVIEYWQAETARVQP